MLRKFTIRDLPVLTSTDRRSTTVLAFPNKKRDTDESFGVTSYGSSRLSSACTCLISTAPTTTVTDFAVATSTLVASPGPCGIGPGFTDNPFDPSVDDHFIGQIGSGNSPADCKAICLATTGCMAYAIGDGNCYGYSDIIANDAFSYHVESPYYFYDNTCPV
jgi:hypothetical protein